MKLTTSNLINYIKVIKMNFVKKIMKLVLIETLFIFKSLINILLQHESTLILELYLKNNLVILIFKKNYLFYQIKFKL